MDTPDNPMSDSSPSPESQPSESPQRESSQPHPSDPYAPSPLFDQMREWHEAQQPLDIAQTSRPYSEIWKIVWTDPDVETYRDVLRESDTTVQRSVKWVVSTWGVQFVCVLIGLALFGVNTYDRQGQSADSQFRGIDISVGELLCASVIFIPIVVLLAISLYLIFVVGIPYSVALIFGGEGRFEDTAFLISAIYCPSMLFAAATNFMPQVLAVQYAILLVSVALTFYTIALQVIAIKAVHDIRWLASIIAVLLPVLLVLGFFFCYLLVFGDLNSAT